MLLQSQDAFDTLFELEAPTGPPKELSKSRDPALRAAHTAGTCSWVDGHFAAIYVRDRRLWVRVDSVEVCVDSDVTAELLRSQELSVFAIRKARMPLLQMQYRVPRIDPPLGVDPTPFIDQEDYDFPLFVSRILSDPARRKVFCEEHSDETI
jgi:hypothetical protein